METSNAEKYKKYKPISSDNTESCIHVCFTDICIITTHPYIAGSYELNTGKGYCGQTCNGLITCFGCNIDPCGECTRSCCCCCICVSNTLAFAKNVSDVTKSGYVNCCTLVPPLCSGLCATAVCINGLCLYPCSGRKFLCISIKEQTNWFYNKDIYVMNYPSVNN